MKNKLNEKELIESGLLEVYALGIASDEEKNLAEELLQSSPVARNELTSIRYSLDVYSTSFKLSDHFQNLKNELGEKIESRTLPLLNEYSTIDEWLYILGKRNVHLSENDGDIYFREVSTPDEIYTYVIWAKPGSIIPSEMHADLNEHLLICSGSCEMFIDGKKSYHEAGSFIHIASGVEHYGKVLDKEVLLAVGQRR